MRESEGRDAGDGAAREGGEPGDTGPTGHREDLSFQSEYN